ncbi:MAG TPA: hypothetical protein PJ982_16510 [Lacipirellulaceae bacterium]|nr:hypothetical protein [Lacipirellulaceae bacterium]
MTGRIAFRTALGLLVTGILARGAAAAVNGPIAFTQAGVVSVTLDFSTGGFDHVLELADALGPVGTPLMALTDLVGGPPSADVLGFAPAALGETVVIGSFAAGAEVILRLTNVESLRLGAPGTIGDQTFTGSASVLNPVPSAIYTVVEPIDETTFRVYWEDLFPIDPLDPDPAGALLAGGYDVAFTVTLDPVPEPGCAALAGVAACGLLRWRRRREKR